MPPSSLDNDTFTVFRGLDRNEATGPFLLHVHSGAPAGQEEASTEAPLPYSRGTFQHLFIVSFIQVSKKLLVVRTHQQIFLCDSSFFCFSRVNKKNDEKTCPTTTRISVSLRPCSHSDSSMHRTGSRLPTVEQSSVSPTSLSHTLRDEIEPRNT